jgi:AbiV family abortive infection protein
MKSSALSKSFIACVENGKGLTEDAQLLYDFGRYASAYYFAMLSQEEFAKAFIIDLIKEKVIPWNVAIWRSTQDHSCKQLLAIVMDYLNPSTDDFIKRIQENELISAFPPSVADSINIYRHEKIEKWRSRNWVGDDLSGYDTTAKKVAEGDLDKMKQNSVYVRLSKTGEIASLPSYMSKEMAENELERTNRLHQLVIQISEQPGTKSIEYENLKEVLQLVFKDI